MSDNLNNFVAINSSYFRTSVLCAYNYVMRVLTKMSMMTTLSLYRVNSVGRYSYILGRGPTFFLNRALLRLNPALICTTEGPETVRVLYLQ